MNAFTNVIAALILAAGFAAAGFFVKDGLVNLHVRSVEVKGLAERSVQADAAIWKIPYQITDKSLEGARAKLNASQKAIEAFLISNGVAQQDISIESLSVYERKELDSRVGDVENYVSVYDLSQTIVARSADVKKIEKAAQSTISLVEAGILLRDSKPRYLFTKLNDIKPDMIAESTRNAREAAGKFATDSGSEVGSILNASQGWFNILAQDGGEYDNEEDFINKKVRVITTINFMLKG